ncbi:phthiocerol/phthiodiolone dimycocerosyl transferase family protein [Paraburkholderia sp. ZP32-5]|uniref:phthiocerol/phthiodiolone dimycocerosyl transferase family protein n=1 Tax=Paraburkholderia sp. ZP32-5 TaxID=2883245 RepID=UPI001F3315C0|nr:condensation protein [Paraburkholderia sp. ZP32-5]
MSTLAAPFISCVERPLGATEKFFYLADRAYPNHFTMVGEIAGPTTVAQWQDSLNRVGQHSTLIWSDIEQDDDGVPKFRPITPSSIPLKVVDHDSSAWTAEVAAQISLRFKNGRGPLLRATLLHGAARSIVVLCVHHSIGDALSLSFLLGDLLRVMAGGAPLLSRETAAMEQLVERGSAAAPPPQPAVVEPAAQVLAPQHVQTDISDLDNLTPYVEALCLGSELTHSLRERARTEGATVQTTLASAIATVLRRLTPALEELPLRVLTPVDLRRRLLDHSDHLAVCVGAAILVDNAPQDASWWAKARSLGDGLTGIDTQQSAMGLLGAMEGLMARTTTPAEAAALIAGPFAAEFMVSNLGVVDLPREYGPLKLEALWGPGLAVSFPGVPVIGVSTFGGRLHLLHTNFTRRMGLLEAVRDELIAGLKS